jgi:hypothetical protein
MLHPLQSNAILELHLEAIILVLQGMEKGKEGKKQRKDPIYQNTS